MNHRIQLLALVSLGLLLLLAACASDGPPEDSSQVTATETSTQQESAPESTAITEGETTPDPAAEQPAEASPDPTVGEGTTGDDPSEPASEIAGVGTPSADVTEPVPSQAFANASTALESLESYRFSTSFVFVGEEDGQTEAGSMELIGVIASPNRKHFLWRNMAENETFEIVQIEERAWTFEDGQWEEVPVFVAEAMSQAALVYAPSVTWSGLFGTLQPDATYVGTETVNGVEADHYSATYQQWGAYWQGDLVDAAGDVWIATDGYPVRYDFSATGIDEMGNRGTVTWTMNLSDVNQPIEIEPPAASGADPVSR